MDWDDVTGASHYLVRWRVAGPGNSLNTGVEVYSSDATITVGGYGEWVVRVEACNSAGCGSHSALRFAVEQAATPTPTPQAQATPTPVPTATPQPKPAPSSQADLTPSFSVAINALSFQEGEDAGETTLPEADGGDGELTYSLSPDLPEGLSFAPATRTLSGTPSEAGEFSMTYTAADADGDEAAFTFTITVEAAPETAAQQARAKTRPDAPGSLTVVRAPSATAMNPALDVTWTTPADNGFTITKYNVYYGTDTKNMTKLSPDPGPAPPASGLPTWQRVRPITCACWRSRGITGSTVRPATVRTPWGRPTRRPSLRVNSSSMTPSIGSTGCVTLSRCPSTSPTTRTATP